MEKPAGDIDGNGADLVEGVAHEACNESAFIGGDVNGWGADEANCAFMLEQDGGGFGNEGMEVVEVKVGSIECIGELLAQGRDTAGSGCASRGILSRSEDLLLFGEGREDVVVKKARVEHGGSK